MVTVKICTVCSVKYNASKVNQRFCSSKCISKQYYIDNKQKCKDNAKKNRPKQNAKRREANKHKSYSVCKHCNKDFKKKGNSQIYCSIKCQRKFLDIKNNEKIKIHRKKYYIKNKNKIKTKDSLRYYQLGLLLCDRCGLLFERKSNTQIYCSGRCNKESDYERNKTNYNKVALSKYHKRIKNDTIYKLTKRYRSRTKKAIDDYIKRGWEYNINCSSLKLLGCSMPDFKDYFEKLFVSGMSWDNMGDWHIDHIVPISRATDEKDIIKLSHYTNLQPLWAVDNLRKGAKIIEKK